MCNFTPSSDRFPSNTPRSTYSCNIAAPFSSAPVRRKLSNSACRSRPSLENNAKISLFSSVLPSRVVNFSPTSRTSATDSFIFCPAASTYNVSSLYKIPTLFPPISACKYISVPFTNFTSPANVPTIWIPRISASSANPNAISLLSINAVIGSTNDSNNFRST